MTSGYGSPKSLNIMDLNTIVNGSSVFDFRRIEYIIFIWLLNIKKDSCFDCLFNDQMMQLQWKLRCQVLKFTANWLHEPVFNVTAGQVALWVFDWLIDVVALALVLGPDDDDDDVCANAAFDVVARSRNPAAITYLHS